MVEAAAAPHQVENLGSIASPALVVFLERVEANLDAMVRLAGGVERLRPHCKTHKMPAVVRLQMERGITRHKCATVAEAEMLARCGVQDILLAYPIVGPNIDRVVRLRKLFPAAMLRVLVDHPGPLEELARALQTEELSIDVLVDLDTGQQRTGVAPGPEAMQLYRQVAETEGMTAGGLHVYDGQNHQTDPGERSEAVERVWETVVALRSRIEEEHGPLPRIVAGGTATFPLYAAKEVDGMEVSPGTCVFHDAGYAEMFPDLPFEPAAALLTRVISRPSSDRVTLDLGYKACASDPPAGHRLHFPQFPEAEELLQNEEHLVLRSPAAAQLAPGATLWAIPRHICPTSALHKEAIVVQEGKVIDRWQVEARDRRLSV